MLTIRTSKCNTIIEAVLSSLFFGFIIQKGWFVGNAEVNPSPLRLESRFLRVVSDHRCEITGVKFRAGLLSH